MASSGIEIDPDLKEDFSKMKQRKLVPPKQLLVMQLSSDKKRIEKNEDMCMEICSREDLLELFGKKANQCFYAVLDYNGKLILIKWAPDTAPAAQKMICASTFSTLKTAFDGTKGSIEATDLDDLSESNLSSAK